MAKKTELNAGSASLEETASPATSRTADEEQPQRGGSYVRAADGTLTQTDGHGFAHDADNQG